MTWPRSAGTLRARVAMAALGARDQAGPLTRRGYEEIGGSRGAASREATLESIGAVLSIWGDSRNWSRRGNEPSRREGVLSALPNER